MLPGHAATQQQTMSAWKDMAAARGYGTGSFFIGADGGTQAERRIRQASRRGSARGLSTVFHTSFSLYCTALPGASAIIVQRRFLLHKKYEHAKNLS